LSNRPMIAQTWPRLRVYAPAWDSWVLWGDRLDSVV
jgi:hypothetical protein